MLMQAEQNPAAGRITHITIITVVKNIITMIATASNW